MERCANTESLNAYMEKQDEAIKIEEEFEEKLNEIVQPLIDEAVEAFDEICKQFESIELSFDEYIRNK